MSNSTAGRRATTAATLFSRLVLGLVFALAAATKITTPGLFRQDVASYHILPPGLIGPFALALPWIEALVALYLLLGLFLRPTAIVTAILLVIFIIALGVSLQRGNVNHSCGCLPTSGPLASLPGVTWLAGGSTISPFDVARDIIFVLMAATVYYGDRYTLSLDGVLFGPRTAPFDDDEEIGQAPPTPAVARRR